MTDITIKKTKTECKTIGWDDLEEGEKMEFNYYDTEKERRGFTGFRFAGIVYDLGEFMPIREAPFGVFPQQHPFVTGGWNEYSNDSYFSGIVIQYGETGDSVIVSLFYC